MMIDDDDVALHRPAVHFGDKTSIPRAAFLAETGVGASVELVPERARFRQRCQLRPVARLRVLLPCSNRAVVLDFIQAAEDLLYGLRHLKLASAEFVCGVGA